MGRLPCLLRCRWSDSLAIIGPCCKKMFRCLLLSPISFFDPHTNKLGLEPPPLRPARRSSVRHSSPSSPPTSTPPGPTVVDDMPAGAPYSPLLHLSPRHLPPHSLFRPHPYCCRLNHGGQHGDVSVHGRRRWTRDA